MGFFYKYNGEIITSLDRATTTIVHAQILITMLLNNNSAERKYFHICAHLNVHIDAHSYIEKKT